MFKKPPQPQQRKKYTSTNASYKIPVIHAQPSSLTTHIHNIQNHISTHKIPIGISLGFRCLSAQRGVELGLRGTKKLGYKTCPFDLMVSPYKQMIECIKNDFADFVNPEYLKVEKQVDNDIYIKNIKYEFIFNHESPVHANFCTIERWPLGKDHFVLNNYKLLIERYQTRIDNFRAYVNDPNVQVHFIVQRYNAPPIELEQVLSSKYPDLDFKIAWISSTERDRELGNVRSTYSNLVKNGRGEPLSADDPELTRFKEPHYRGPLSSRCYRFLS